jgi:hypothetical protein
MVLAILLPAAFAVGLAARQPVPTAKALSTALSPAPRRFESVEWKCADLFPNAPVRVCLLREQKQSGRFGIKLTADASFVKPDLIVYWCAGLPPKSGPVPQNAILLGTFNSEALLLPEEATKSGGGLLLFSLADGEVVAATGTLPLPATGPLSH